MTAIDDLAARMYPQQEPTPTAPTARSSGTIVEDLAQRMFPPPPAYAAADPAPNGAVAQVRAMDATARAMFKDVDQWGGPADGSGGVVRDLAEAVREAFPESDKGPIGKQVSALASVFVDVGMDKQFVEDLAGIVKTHAGVAFDDQVRSEMRGDVVKDLKQQYGKEFANKLADAQRLVNRDPRLAGFLVATGLGDNPKVIRKMIELAAAQRAAGKLK